MQALLLCDDCRPAEVAELSRSHGCGIEVQSFYDAAYIDREHDTITKHRDFLHDIDLRSVHGPFPDLNPGSTDRMLQLVTANRYQLGVNVARRLDVGHIILHHGYVPGTYQASTWIKNFSGFWKEFLSGLPPGLLFHIENLFDKEPNLLADAVAAIEDDRVDICLDVGHANCFSELPVAEWIQRLRTQIGYVHLHNNNGERDEHLDLENGTIDMVEVCNELEDLTPNAMWALEVSVDSLGSAIAWLSTRGFR